MALRAGLALGLSGLCLPLAGGADVAGGGGRRGLVFEVASGAGDAPVAHGLVALGGLGAVNRVVVLLRMSSRVCWMQFARRSSAEPWALVLCTKICGVSMDACSVFRWSAVKPLASPSLRQPTKPPSSAPPV